MSVIFALPRHPYASYADYYRLIELSGFEQCFIDQIDQSSDNTYIVTIYNGEFGDFSGSRARIVMTDLEWHVGDNALPPLSNVEVWVCDAWYAKLIGAKYWAMGSHTGLMHEPAGMTENVLLDYDVAYIGFIEGLHRRELIRRQLIERGVNVSPMVAWNGFRHAILTSSKSYLHIHQHAHIPAVPPLRMVVAAAYSLPVISETCADAGVFKHYIREVEYQDIPVRVEFFLHEQGEYFAPFLKRDGVELHQFLCEELTFRKSVEAAL